MSTPGFLVGCVAWLLVVLALLRAVRRGTTMSVGHVSMLLSFGAAGWILAKIPKALVVLPVMAQRGLSWPFDPGQVEALLRSDLVFLAIAAGAAAVFEEALKPIVLLARRSLLKSYLPLAVGFVIGLGAGMLEALNTFLGAVILSTRGVEPLTLMQPAERIVVTLFHGLLTALVVHGYSRRVWSAVAAAIGLHFAMDFFVPLLQLRDLAGEPLALVVISAIAGGTALLTRRAAQSPPPRTP